MNFSKETYILVLSWQTSVASVTFRKQTNKV